LHARGSIAGIAPTLADQGARDGADTGEATGGIGTHDLARPGGVEYGGRDGLR